jgi:hypothetical protein
MNIQIPNLYEGICVYRGFHIMSHEEWRELPVGHSGIRRLERRLIPVGPRPEGGGRMLLRPSVYLPPCLLQSCLCARRWWALAQCGTAPRAARRCGIAAGREAGRWTGRGALAAAFVGGHATPARPSAAGCCSPEKIKRKPHLIVSPLIVLCVPRSILKSPANDNNIKRLLPKL